MTGLPDQLHVALKEWATVCGALEAGRQIMLLRKGGIYEAGGEFEIEHREFLLFPTYLHQNAAMLKPGDAANVAPAQAEPKRIRISAAGRITDIIAMPSRAAMDRLDDEHIWARDLIDMRFAYRPENPLYLLLVRVYRLGGAVEIENTPAYAGCKSWVPLGKPIAMEAATAALNDAVYAARRKGIRDRMG